MTTNEALNLITATKNTIAQANEALEPIEYGLSEILRANMTPAELTKWDNPTAIRALLIGRLIDLWLAPLYTPSPTPNADATAELNHLDHLIGLANALELALEVVKRARPDLLSAAMLRQTPAPTV